MSNRRHLFDERSNLTDVRSNLMSDGSKLTSKNEKINTTYLNLLLTRKTQITMTNKQEATEKMSLAAVSFLLANPTITAGLPNFTTYFTVIQTTNTQIQAAELQQENDRSGDTLAKQVARTTLITQAMDVSRRVVAYATNVSNNTLLELVNYTESDLKRSSDTKLISSCQVIRDNANANVAALGTYGVTAAIVTALQTAITNFSATLPKVRVDTTDRGEATKLLATLFKTLLANWAKIDTLVEMVRTAQPNFYTEYQLVRKVIVLGTGNLALKVQANDAQNGVGLANVTLTLTPANTTLRAASTTQTNIVKKTAKGGGANYKGIADGEYTVVAKKPGFKDVATSVSVVNGELTLLEIQMEK